MAIHIGQIEDISSLPWLRHKHLAQTIRDFERHTGQTMRFPFLAFWMCWRGYVFAPLWAVAILIAFGATYLLIPIGGLSAMLIGWRVLRLSKWKTALLTLGALIFSIPVLGIAAIVFPVLVVFLPHHYYAQQWLRHLQEETGTGAADPDEGLTENRVLMPGNPRDGYLLIRQEVERVEFHGGTYLGILHTGSDELIDLAQRHWAFHWRHRESLPVTWDEDSEELATAPAGA